MPVQGSLIENDHVVEALAANRTDDAFHVATLPRGSRCRQNFRDSHGFYISRELIAEDPVAVSKQVTRNLLKGKGLPELLRGPLGRRMSGDVEMHDPPSLVSQDQEHLQDLKPDRRHGEEVHRDHGFDVILKESPPVL